MNVGDSLRFGHRNFPNKEALVFGSNRLTYAQLNRRVNGLAHSLLQLGMNKGDKAAIMLQNCSEYIEIYYALAKIGAVAVPLNFMLKGKGLEFLANNSDAKMMFLEEQTRECSRRCQGQITADPDRLLHLRRFRSSGWLSSVRRACSRCTYR